MSTSELVRVPVVVVWVPVAWHRLVSILLPTTPHVVPVFGVGKLLVAMASSFLLVDFPISMSEKVPTTSEQRSASLVSLFAPHATTPVELLLTATPSQKLHPRMWRL